LLYRHIKIKLTQKYPKAIVEILATKNIFEQLFNTTETPLQAKIKSTNQGNVPSVEQANDIYEKFINKSLCPTKPNLYRNSSRKTLTKLNV